MFPLAGMDETLCPIAFDQYHTGIDLVRFRGNHVQQFHGFVGDERPVKNAARWCVRRFVVGVVVTVALTSSPGIFLFVNIGLNITKERVG